MSRSIAPLAAELIDWSWVASHLDDIWEKTLEHVWLTVLAVSIGMAISLPIGIVAQRYRWPLPPAITIAGILYTIPSLALFVLLVPVTGLSTLTAEIGLVSYTLLILIRNTAVGLDGVPADVKDAALGMGYTRRQLLWKVELPLALPVMVAGIRLATVTTIGLVTVASLIGKGGLGTFILRGLRQFDPTQTIVGAVLSIVLAVLADAAIFGTQRAITPWSRSQRARAVG